MRVNGYVLHQDNARVVIATGFERASENRKTGDMIQIWILYRHMSPIRAVQTGKDSAICGNCAFRGNGNGDGRSCYVNVGQAPLAVWQAWKRGNYPAIENWDVFAGRAVRFGAYGDPAHIPAPVFEAIVARAARWTGYTHAWRNPLAAGYRRWLMASVETVDGQIEATKAGWRTFRVKMPGQVQMADEVVCPAARGLAQCNRCSLCRGNAIKARNVVIDAHGSGAVYVAAM